MGFGAPIRPDSTQGVARSTPFRETNTQSTGIHYHQNQDDQPPAYTEYAPARPSPSPYNGSTSGYNQAQLRRPIAIPATAASLGSPFLRAYPPSLESFQLSRGEFLDILDSLNRMAVQSPPLKALDVAGDVIQAVPLASAQTIGLVIGTAAKIGTIALSKGATDAYLRKVNEEVFAPRGLKMEVAKLEAMARINGIPILDNAGKIRNDVKLLEPLLDAEKIQTMGAAERWLQALELWVEPLDLVALPPVNMDVNLWGRVHASASERERSSTEKKILKERNKALEKHQKGVDDAEEKRAKALAKLERIEQRARERGSRRVDDRLRRIDQRREKVEMRHHDKIEKVDEHSRSKDKESKAMTKVLWLIIRNLHDGSSSRGYGF
ncbi:hypothetical protein GGS24DRAFT_493680 [Hypoxylon argillaceum]|nr:hypothetical protein GGS24DRAFT_493680 [Hypoxylon argillaceum]